MSLGLTLTDNKVTVIFIENGVYLLASSGSQEVVYPEIKRHIDTLRDLGCELIAETESLKERGLLAQKIEVKRMSRMEIGQVLMESDRVIGF
jgi:sulfur relay (sulfurtransferase) DsrF/TusC family protein